MGVKKMKNGKIEILRFAFSVVIMFFHIGVSVLGRTFTFEDKYTFFNSGYFGVEFFFVLSGFLMASFIYKQQYEPHNLGRETCAFVSKKILKILPLHLIAFCLAFIVICQANQYNFEEASYRFLDGLPNLLLIMRSGLPGEDVLTPEWYLCQMFLAMMLLYPLCRKYYKTFSKVVAPLVAVFVIGYLIQTTGSLLDSTYWLGSVSKSFARAVAELCAGVFVFEVCRYIKNLNFKKFDKLFLSVVEVVCWLAVFAFTFVIIDDAYAGHFLILLCIALCLSFSGVTYGAGCFNNKISSFLGSLSLPMYLLHPVAQKIVEVYFIEYSEVERITIFVVLTFVLCLLVKPFEIMLEKAIFKKIKQLKKSNN